jgi:hypothetical protein
MHFLSSLFKIVIIDLVLSGDNAVVIGMAAHRLPYRQRKIAILCGGGRRNRTAHHADGIAAVLLRVSGLQIIGGVLADLDWFQVIEAGRRESRRHQSRGQHA